MARSEGWLLTLLVVGLILFSAKWQRPSPATVRAQPNAQPTPSPLQPRTADDCPACRAAQPGHPPASTPPQPYSPVKSPRGPLRENRIATIGFAGPNADCLYFGITDDQIHALVGYGGHGRQECIRASRLKCQACRTIFSVRYGTVLYRLKTPARRVGEVLSALAEGLSVGAAVRVFGHGEFTIRTWLTRAGLYATSLHERLFQKLKFAHIQLDELCTKTQRSGGGPCRRARTHGVLAPDCLPIFTSDGLKLYFYALTAHFGSRAETVGKQTHLWQVRAGLLYGQLTKHYTCPNCGRSCQARSGAGRRRRLGRVERRALLGSLDQLTAALRTGGDAQRAPFRPPSSNG